MAILPSLTTDFCYNSASKSDLKILSSSSHNTVTWLNILFDQVRD